MPDLDPAEREDFLARLVATRFVPGRFKGRKDLEQRAFRGDHVALVRLEVLLGLADESAVTAAYEAKIEEWLREATKSRIPMWAWPKPPIEKLQRIAQVPQGKRLPWITGLFARKDPAVSGLVPPEVVEAIERKQHLRRLLKEASETHEPPIERFLKKKLSSVTWATNIRRTRHHTQIVKIVEPGKERVTSENYGFWPAHGRWPERGSKHEWYISRAMLLPETRALQTQNRTRVYLTPEKRVRGGQGSALVTEVLNKMRKRPRWIVRG